MTIISYYACDRCGTDSHDETFTQFKISAEGGAEIIVHFCESCVLFLKGEIQTLNIAMERNRKKRGKK